MKIKSIKIDHRFGFLILRSFMTPFLLISGGLMTLQPSSEGSSFLVISPTAGFASSIDAGEGSFSVTSNVAWQASTESSWINLQTASGSGNGTVRFTFSENSPPSNGRVGIITVSGQGIQMNYQFAQPGMSQQTRLSIDPTSRTHSARNFLQENRTVNIVSETNEDWEAISNVPWIIVYNGLGAGNGTFTYALTNNHSIQARTGTVSIRLHDGTSINFTVTQRGASVGVQPTSRSHAPAAASDQTFSVYSNTEWYVSTLGHVSWITRNTMTGSGNGTVSYSISENTSSSSRSATIVVLPVEWDGTSAHFEVVQEGRGGSNTLSIDPSSRNHSASAASNQTISVSSNVSWTVSTNRDWINLHTTSGSGNRIISYSVSANSSTSSRSGSITVSGGGLNRTFSINQAGSSPSATLSLSPTSRSHEASGASNQSISVTSNTSWNVSSSASWINLHTTSGAGNGTINYSISANSSTSSRSGSITVSGGSFGSITRSFSVTQEGSTEAPTWFSEFFQVLLIVASHSNKGTVLALVIDDLTRDIQRFVHRIAPIMEQYDPLRERSPDGIFVVASPVDIILRDPSGRLITSDNAISNNVVFIERDVAVDGDTAILILFYTDEFIEYTYEVIPHQGSAGEQFSLYTYNGDLSVPFLEETINESRIYSGTFPIYGGPSNLWRESTFLGQSWNWLEWLGYFWIGRSGWIYHLEHGWWYYVGDSTEEFFVYDSDLGNWGWISNASYPWIYWFEPVNHWALYDRGGHPGDRWFFHTGAQEWRHEEDLMGMAPGVVYFEDFTSDPGFVSLKPEHLYWDASSGVYHIKTRRYADPAAIRNAYMAKSPVFTRRVEPDRESFSISMRVNPRSPGYANYPAVNLADSRELLIGPNVETFTGLHLRYVIVSWADHVPRRMQLREGNSGLHFESPSVIADTWYRVDISFDAVAGRISWEVRDDSTGQLFATDTALNITIPAFDQIVVGHAVSAQAYNREAVALIDWIEIRTEGSQ